MLSCLLSRITGRQHHFKIVLKFYPDRRQAAYHVFRMQTVWMRNRRNILDERMLRKIIGPSMVRSVPRHRLKNGGIDIAEVYYLGWLRPRNSEGIS